MDDNRTTINSEKIEVLKNYTLEGNYAGAINLAVKCLQSDIVPELISEIIRLTILTKDFDNAYNFIKKFNELFSKNTALAEEILLRFNIETRFQYQIGANISIRPSMFEWVNKYNSRMSDTLYMSDICMCNVICYGAFTYTFTLMCSCCGKRFKSIVTGTLLIKKELFCPCCLSRQLLTFEMIRLFVFKKHNLLISHKGISMDKDVGKIPSLVNQASYNNELGEIGEALGQDTAFALVQLLTEELLDE